ncbi:glycine/betaine ABC transporter substrate-binding protein [Parasedimentitalea marina]|uniref:Glycine/betaine ABC transporter substrate-binding protein n=2 Tax=Parasedimentitalea marina TaxID=2483033 RepID=A0A3T0MZ61_9RHOB|nr:glycine/betaine ABC transporter substrate-binding protein [Parasedimentitalea marina]
MKLREEMMKMNLNTAVAALAISVATVTAPMAQAESQDPIKIAVNEWTGQHLSANIAAELLKKMGYSVEMVTAGGLPQFTALEQGELHFNPEVWDNSITDAYTNGLTSGAIVDMGQLGLEPREGWIYPDYMAEQCPGLPSYQALYDCAQAFANAESFPNGRLITYPADWGTRSKSVVEGTGLPFNPVPGGSEGAMVAELKSALASKEPILMMFWQPHWVFAEVDMNWVEWNPAQGECVEEDQQRDTACGFAQASVNKIVSKSLPENWPKAAKFIEQFTLTNAEQNAMILEVDQGGRPLEEVVQDWITANEAKWTSWIN